MDVDKTQRIRAIYKGKPTTHYKPDNVYFLKVNNKSVSTILGEVLVYNTLAHFFQDWKVIDESRVKHPTWIGTNTKVYRYKKDGSYLDQFDTMNAAAEEVNVSRYAILKAITRKYRSGGYRWAYKQVTNIIEHDNNTGSTE